MIFLRPFVQAQAGACATDFFRSLLGAEKAEAAGFFETWLEIVPQSGTAGFDRRSDAFYDPLVAYAVLAPALALIGQVQENGHGAVDGAREAGLRGLAGFELLPQGEEMSTLRGGQNPEDASDSGLFSRMTLLPASIGKRNGVSSVDFTNVVDEKKLYDTVDIDWQFSAMGDGNCQQGQLPTVLRGVLVSIQPERTNLAGHTFQLFQFEDELNDLLHVDDEPQGR